MLVWPKSNAFTFILPPVASAYYVPVEVLGMQRRNAKFLPSRCLWSAGETALPDVQIMAQLTVLLLWWRHQRHERTLETPFEINRRASASGRARSSSRSHSSSWAQCCGAQLSHTFHWPPAFSGRSQTCVLSSVLGLKACLWILWEVGGHLGHFFHIQITRVDPRRDWSRVQGSAAPVAAFSYPYRVPGHPDYLKVRARHPLPVSPS